MRTPAWWQELRQLARLAAPVITVQLGMMLLGVVDSMMVGHLSAQALAAVSLGHIYTFGILILGMGVLFALDPLVSHAHGAGDAEAITQWLQRGLVLALVLSALSVIPFLAAGPILRLLGQPAEILPQTVSYIRVIGPGVPGMFLFVVVRQSLQAMSIVRPVLWSVILANVLNVVLNDALVYGHWGAPALGSTGSAWASTASRWAMFLGAVAFSRRHLAPYWQPLRRHLLAVYRYRPLVRLGIPIGVQMGLEVWVFQATALFIGTLGTVPLAGHQIAMNLASVSFMVPLGIGAAAATRVGNALGRGDMAAARLSARVSMALGGAVMLVSATLFAVIPATLARLYTNDPQIIGIAVTLLPLAALFQVFDGTQVVACGVLRGAADTRVAAVVNLIGYWVLALPLGYALTFPLGMGPPGMWWGLTAGLATVAVLLIRRVAQRFA